MTALYCLISLSISLYIYIEGRWGKGFASHQRKCLVSHQSKWYWRKYSMIQSNHYPRSLPPLSLPRLSSLLPLLFLLQRHSQPVLVGRKAFTSPHVNVNIEWPSFSFSSFSFFVSPSIATLPLPPTSLYIYVDEKWGICVSTMRCCSTCLLARCKIFASPPIIVNVSYEILK